MKWTFRTRFYAVVALQLLLLAVLIAYKQFTILTGERLLLETVPVDPRDLFRGDYVALRYKISRLDSTSLDIPAVQKGDSVYVSLHREGRFWTAESVSKEPPRAAVLFLRGQVTNLSVASDGRLQEITVTYGIESYFVPEGRGKELERLQGDRSGALIVEAAVDRNGRAVIREVHIERGSGSNPTASPTPTP